MCRMREEIVSLQDRIEEIEKTRTFKNEIFSDLKKHNRHLFILCVIIFIVLVGLVGYVVYLLNDVGKTTQSIEIEGCSITKIADVTHLSERTVNRRIKELKKKVIKVL